MLKILRALDAVSKLVFFDLDPHEGSAVLNALQGPGKPAGVRSCDLSGGTLTVSFDQNDTPQSLIRHLVDIERRRFAAPRAVRVRELDDAQLARLVAEATGDPDLDEDRILEHLVPELDR